MKKTARWGAAVGVICGAELVVAALIGSAGLAVLLRPAMLGLAISVVAAIVGVLILRRRRALARP